MASASRIRAAIRRAGLDGVASVETSHGEVILRPQGVVVTSVQQALDTLRAEVEESVRESARVQSAARKEGREMTSTHEAVTADTITLAQIRSLRAEAAAAGDVAMVDTCERAELAVYDPSRGSDAACATVASLTVAPTRLRVGRMERLSSGGG